MQMPTVTGNAFVPNQFSYFQALVSACKTKNPNKAMEVITLLNFYSKNYEKVESHNLLKFST